MFTKIVSLLFGASLVLWSTGHFPAAAQVSPSQPSMVEIVLPLRLVAGHPATLATLGAEGKLSPHVTVEFGTGEHFETDATGRANFTAPAAGVLLAKSGSASAAVLVDPDSAASVETSIRVAPFASTRDRLNVCGGGFQGNAEANRVYVNDEPALVLAASPECLAIVPDPKTTPGAAKISVEGGTAARQIAITLVSLDFEPPHPPLTPTQKGWLTLRAHGSDRRLRVLAENETPDVLRFEKGDAQEVITTGGAQNAAEIRVEAIRSGDFSFRARLWPPLDREAARRFLEAAEPLAIADVRGGLKNMQNELLRHPHNLERVRIELDEMISLTSPGGVRTLLEAARNSL
jgi:hypothetical protein